MDTSLVGMGWRRTGLFASLLLNLHPLAVSGQGVPLQFREVHMGLEVSITAHGPPAQLQQAAAAAFARIAALEQILSDWRPSSELNQVVLTPLGQWQPISSELEAVLARALDVAAATDGAFDPTIGALTRLWREERLTGRPPDATTRARAHRAVNWRALDLDTASHRIRFAVPGIQLDVGGIAKGWILDQARETMSGLGITAVLIEAGGDLVVGEAPPGTDGWRVNVRTTTGDSILVVQHVAMATSGSSAQSIRTADGTRQSHVIDPTNGRGLHHGTEVTVIAADGASADAVATALTIMPEDRWNGLLARFGVRVVSVVRGKADTPHTSPTAPRLQ